MRNIRNNTKMKKRKLKARKNDFSKAIHIIKNKDMNFSVVNKSRRLHVMNLCHHDRTILNVRRQNCVVTPTTTQLLLSQLRTCISNHNWPAVARCVHYMLDMNGKLLSVIWKSVMLILFNHVEVTTQKLNDFLEMCLGLRTPSDKAKFLETLFTLPEDISIHSEKIKEETSDDVADGSGSESSC